MYATTRYNCVRLKATHTISPLEELVGGRSPPLQFPEVNRYALVVFIHWYLCSIFIGLPLFSCIDIYVLFLLDCPCSFQALIFMFYFYWLALAYLLTLPLCTGVSRIRALSPAWTGSPARSPPNKKLFSRFWGSLPSLLSTFKNFRPWKKSSTIKSWPTFCNQYFWKFPIWNSRADEKRREIRMVKVNVIFKWYPVIDLFDTFTDKLGHGH